MSTQKGKAMDKPLHMMTMDEKMDVSVDIINGYADKYHKRSVECQLSPEKGRVLYSNRDFKPGEAIFIEPPLHAVKENAGNASFATLKKMQKEHNFDFEPLWYWCALNTVILKEEDKPEWQRFPLERVTEERRNYFLTLFAPDVDEPSKHVLMLVEGLGLKGVVDPLLLEKLLQVWIHNCFEFTENPLGYSVYFISSFLAHSCMPNAVWHYDEKDNFVLRARTHIKKGEELSVSYLSEDALFQPALKRQKTLESTKSFLCSCIRCSAPLDLSRGFCCPACRTGTVFFRPSLSTPRDPYRKDAKGMDASAAAAHDNANEVKSHPLTSLWLKGKYTKGAEVCQACGHRLSVSERKFLQHQEKHYIEQMKIFEGDEEEDDEDEQRPHTAFFQLPLDTAKYQSIEHNLRALFTQHWVLVKWLGVCHDAKAKVGESMEVEPCDASIKVLRERYHMQKAMYPSENGAIAWGLEELADSLLDSAGFRKDADPTSLTSQSVAKLSEKGHALEILKEAQRMLLTLFGPTHEYSVKIQKTLKEVQRQIDAVKS